MILNSRDSTTTLNPDDEPRPDSYDDFVTFDATLSQLYIPQPSLSPQEASGASLEPLEPKDIPLEEQQILAVSRANSTDPFGSSRSSFCSAGQSTPASSLPAGSSSPGSSAAAPSSPVNYNGQVPRSPRPALFSCTQCPNRAPFRLQSQLT